MNNNNNICFILDHNLMEYRIPLFEQLSERNFEITIVHTGTKAIQSPFFRQYISSQKNLILIYRKLPELSKFSVVVHMQNLRIWNLWLLTLNPFKRYKVIHWGIGISSAKGLISNRTLISRIRNLLVTCASAQILYSDFPFKLFSKKVQAKTFIANNTIFNPNSENYSNYVKDSFIFIGSLNRRKGLEVLINVFSKYLRAITNIHIDKLVIIGDGSIMNELRMLVASLGIENHVVFTGRISDAGLKENYFKNAIASISPLQAGLSVLESFSYGVPFLSYKDAISGGEHLNIKNEYNGYLVDSENELLIHMINLNNDIDLGIRLGNNAFNFYNEKRKMSDMVDSFEDAFNFVLNK